MTLITDDGKGDYVIPKGLFALIAIVLMLVSCIATVAAMGATMQSDILSLKETTKEIDTLDERLHACGTHAEVTMMQINDMKEDIRVIRKDVQELLKR